jgi:hypothetical protein
MMACGSHVVVAVVGGVCFQRGHIGVVRAVGVARLVAVGRRDGVGDGIVRFLVVWCGKVARVDDGESEGVVDPIVID